MVHKHRIVKTVVLAGSITLSFLLAMAQSKKEVPGNASAIVTIETYCKQLDAFVKQHKKQARIWATVDAEGKQWRVFKSEKARLDADGGDNLNENAMVWMRNGKLVYAGFTFQSPSRDWAHYVNYYFREDGTLAKIDANLNTFYGNMTVIRKRFYSVQGTLLKSSVQYLDLKTRTKKKPDDTFIDAPLPIYKNVTSLPFYALL
ncbi:MAG TPA: hypothetical protein VFZ34_16420 [Blastocatellia bacterium]|nr:hypothetical protein [Blastocatellia bacterium]